MTSEQQAPTLGRMARRTMGTLFGAVRNRTELFVVELEEEHYRLVRMIVFAVIGLVLGHLTLLLLTATIILLVPDDHRVYAALGFAVAYFAGAVAAGLILKALLKKTPFRDSLDQLKKDAELMDAFK